MTPATRLILVEGIPGSGKTTTARFISGWLAQHGQSSALYLEGDWDHPADYESTACLDENEYAALQAQFPDSADFIARHARYENGEWFFQYRKMQHEYGGVHPEGLFEALARYEIYDLPAEKHRRIMRQSWKTFTGRALTEDRTYIFECCFLQNPFTTLLAYHNLPESAVYQHVLDLAAIIQPLQPRLVYLSQIEPRITLEKVRAERSQAWADYVTGYITGREYGQAHGLRSFEGVSQFYAAQQALELELLKSLPVPSILLSDQLDWETRYGHLVAFLEKRIT